MDQRPIIRMLGPVEIGPDGSIPTGPLECTLLAALAVSRGAVTVERLIDDLWGDDPPNSARNRVQALVSSLRRKIPREALLTRPTGYALADGLTDLNFFEQLVNQARAAAATGDLSAAVDAYAPALALWRGQAIEGCDSPRIAAAAEGLNELRRCVWEDYVDTRLAAGDHARLVPELAGLVAESPLRPRLRGQLMIALYRSGRQAEALEQYRTGAVLLAEASGMDPPADLVRLRDAILADQVPQARPSAIDVSADAWDVTVAAPRQLPAAPGDFVGRDHDLSTLADVLAPAAAADGSGPCVVASIAGMPGVGKTAFAVQLAHLISGQYPGGCLYADLAGTEPVPAQPATVLAGFLRALGLPSEAIPEVLDERAALFRSLVAGRRTLVVLDNAHDEQQVRPLLPGNAAAVLVTSRRLLSGLAGATFRTIGPLGEPDALALLGRIVGTARVDAEPQDARRIVELCGALPLAIRIASVRIAQGDTPTMHGFAVRLADTRRRLDELTAADLDVRATLAIAVRELPDDARHLLGALSRVPFPTVGTWLAAAMLGEGRHGARLLEQLRRAQLLLPTGTDRYRMHDLVRLYARETVTGDHDVVLALDALATRALAESERLPCHPVPTGDRHSLIVAEPVRRDALHWFDAELGNIMVGVQTAAHLGRSDLAWRLANATTNFFLLRGNADDGYRSHRLVLDEAGAELADTGRVLVSLGLAAFLRMRDRIAEAYAMARTAYRVARRTGEPWLIGTAALSWAVCAAMMGAQRMAVVAAAVATGWIARSEISTDALGYCLLIQHQLHPDLEFELIDAAADMFERNGDLWGLAEAQTFIGVAHYRHHRFDLAIKHLRISADAYGELGDVLNQNVADVFTGGAHVAAGQPQLAIPILRRALATARSTHHPWSEAKALHHIGNVHLASGAYDRAVDHLERAATIFQAIGQPRPLATTNRLLARARQGTPGGHPPPRR